MMCNMVCCTCKFLPRLMNQQFCQTPSFQSIAMPLKGPSQLPHVVLGTKVRVHRSTESSAWPQPKGIVKSSLQGKARMGKASTVWYLYQTHNFFSCPGRWSFYTKAKNANITDSTGLSDLEIKVPRWLPAPPSPCRLSK